MATTADIEDAKQRTDGADGWDDTRIGEYLDAGRTVYDFARMFWEGKAAAAATLVDISESGSSRSNSQLHKAALLMADRFGTAPDAGVLIPGKTTRRAVRR